MQPANLFDSLPADRAAEAVEAIAQGDRTRIERIVSYGQASPEGFWYDQDEAEWVVVLAGEALLRFEDEPAARRLRPGDHVTIAAHRRHRVDWTTPDGPTVWVAVFFPG